MEMPSEMSSISKTGYAANSSRNNNIKNLGENGIMEFEQGYPGKRVINCLAGGEEQAQSFTYLAFDNCHNDNAGFEDNDFDQVFSLRDICAYGLNVDCFDNALDTQQFAEEHVIIWACSVLKYSPSARAMLKEACDKGWSIALEDRNGGDYCMNVEARLLIIDNGGLSGNALARSEYFLNRLLITFSKALRDVWQEKRFGGFDEDYGPKDVVLMERVRFADLDTLSVLIAWELREQGYEECWRHLSGSETCDLAMAFANYLERRPAAALDLRQALLAAFKQWFCEEGRIDACDHDTLEYLDEVLDASELVNPFGQKTPGRMNVEMLSTLPSGAAYLQGQGGEILDSRTFCSLTNDLNSAHLTHIMNDIESITIENISFRDPDLARKIFPEMFVKEASE
jgi:hypothetical protein